LRWRFAPDSASCHPWGSELSPAGAARADRGQLSGEVFGVGGCDEDDLYVAMDWLQDQDSSYETALSSFCRWPGG